MRKVFNNPSVVTEGWYLALPSKKLKQKPKTIDLCGQKVTLYRGQSGSVYALDAYCPHMGVDLGLGKVCGENIKCFFHHWQFDGKGRCKHIPAGEKPPKNLKNKGYATEEKYGYIWVWPQKSAKCPVPEIPELEGFETSHWHGRSFSRNCHYHVTMINGIDPQHLSTVHKLNLNMNIEIDKSTRSTIHYILRGQIPNTSLSGRIGRFFLGDSYAYAVKYNYGTIGLLTTMKDIKLFNKYELPCVHTIFAYSKNKTKGSKVTPIFVTKKRKGLHGWLLSQLLLLMAKVGFFYLQGEDGKVYQNIKFNANSFLKIDRPVAQFVHYIDGLKPSEWGEGFAESSTLPSEATRPNASLDLGNGLDSFL